MERIEDKPEGRLMVAVFEEKGSNFYPYIVIEEEGKKIRIELMTAVQKALETVSPKERRALELRFGLLDDQPRFFREVGSELSRVTGSRAQQIVVKALRRLRYPSRSRVLRQFLVPSPEEVNYLRKEIDRLREENRSLNESNQGLKKGRNVTEEEIGGIKPENLASTAQALKKEREEFEALMIRFPNKRVWNAVRRYINYIRKIGIIKLPMLKEMVESGEILKNGRNFGVKAEAFLKNVLQTIEKEASP